MFRILRNATRVRWTVVAISLIGVIREFLGPYVRFQLPELLEQNATLLFIVLGLMGTVLVFYDSLSTSSTTAQETPQSAPPPPRTVTIAQVLRFVVKLTVGLTIATVLCAVYVAVKSASFEWSSTLEEIALVWLLLFAGWMFLPLRLV